MIRDVAVVSLALAAATLAGERLVAQSTNTRVFDVASVKENTGPPGGARFTVLAGGQLTIANLHLREIIRVAYQVPDEQLIGPEWIRAARFDIVARSNGMPPLRFPPGLDTPGHPVYEMLRALLAERFKLAVHHERRAMPMFALVMLRPDRTPGPQLRRSTTDCAAINAGPRPSTNDPGRASGPSPCGIVGSGGTVMRVSGDSQPMTQLVYVLAGYAERPIVDRTGLTGLFSFTLEFRSDDAAPDVPAPSDVPSFFTAVQQQLGLKLEPTREQADVVVIDSVSLPTPN